MKILFKNVKIVTPGKENTESTDILITDGVISKIGSVDKKESENAKVYEFENCYAAPGFFDMHVHLREPGREDEETILTGTNAAAAGGFTGIACMPNTSPAIDSAEVVNFIKWKADKYLVDVFPVGTVTPGRNGEALAPMAEMFEAGAVAFSDDGKSVKNSSLLYGAFEYSGMYGVPILEHCQDESLADGVMNEGEVSTMLGLPPIPSIAEDIIVMRDISIAEYTGGKLHIAPVSTKRSVELIRDAKKRGVKVTAEVTPHHFTLTEEAVKSYDSNCKVNPPLRGKEDLEALIEGLKDGTIDCIASNHAPHAIEEKEMEFIYAPDGIVGLETTMGLALSELVHKKHITLTDLVKIMAVNPREILSLPVPEIKEGEPANITFFDPDAVWTVDVKDFKSKSKNSPFDKRLLNGKSIAVVNKNLVYVEGKFNEA